MENIFFTFTIIQKKYILQLNVESTSGIKKGDTVLKTLYTPDIVRTDEPNEILIEIDTGKLCLYFL